jgi:hypothetical protein
VAAVSVVISPERGESSFIGSGVVETKGRELNPGLNRLCIHGPLRKGFGNVQSFLTVFLRFGPHWHATKGVTCLSSYGYGLTTSSLTGMSL